jgi:hypothetical protein
LGKVTDAAQDEEPDQRERHPDDGAPIGVHQHAVAEFLGEQRKAGHGGREQHAAEHAEHETAAIGREVSE